MSEQVTLPYLRSLRKQLRKRGDGHNVLPFAYPKSRSDVVAKGYRPVYRFLVNVLRSERKAFPRKVCKDAQRWLSGLVRVVPDNWVGAVWKATKVVDTWVDFSTLRRQLRKKAKFGRSKRVRLYELVREVTLEFMGWIPLLSNLYRAGRTYKLYRKGIDLRYQRYPDTELSTR